MTQQTNFRLGKKNKQGKYTPSYIQQMVEKLVYRKKLMEAVMAESMAAGKARKAGWKPHEGNVVQAAAGGQMAV